MRAAARGGGGGHRIDRPDQGIRVRRANEDRVRLAGEIDIDVRLGARAGEFQRAAQHALAGRQQIVKLQRRKFGFDIQCIGDATLGIDAAVAEAQRDLTPEQAAQQLRGMSNIHYREA